MATVFSGIQPTGEVHLGNYLGALRRFVVAQDVDDCIFCIVDLHALTENLPDPEELRAKTLDLAAIYLAAGIDPGRSTLFVQSQVHEHAELAWILNNFTAFGELRRMTQFKDKSGKRGEGFVSAGLFDYPVLMAADILLYQTDRVPVGDDQRQHLELSRDIAERFNARFPGTFVVPDADIPPAEGGARIMDFQDPESKMSKSSDSPQGTIGVTDPPEVLRRKVKTAVTDSGRDIVARQDKPAITNLLTVYSLLAGRSIGDLEREYTGRGYGDLKDGLAEAMIEGLRPLQERHRELVADPGELTRILEVGAEKARAIAAKTLATVYEKLGFLPGTG
ncbi:MAG TPA: tryptophan--tRNA ligase [Actinomycetota bacterium]|jgi:tryptophanyl-tRNA synthetase